MQERKSGVALTVTGSGPEESLPAPVMEIAPMNTQVLDARRDASGGGAGLVVDQRDGQTAGPAPVSLSGGR